MPEGESPWIHAHGEWQNGWVRVTPHLTDAELEDRYRAVGTILLEVQDRAQEGAHRGTLHMVASRAIVNARLAVAYFLRGAPLPPRCFPGPAETIELLGQGEPDPLAPEAPLRLWISGHEPPSWR